MNLAGRLLLVGAILAMLKIEFSECLIACYQCSYSAPCTDPFNATKALLSNCTYPSNSDTCAKLITYDGATNHVLRYCTVATESKCYKTVSGSVCNCQHNNCNDGCQMVPSVFQVLLMVFATNAAVKFFWK